MLLFHPRFLSRPLPFFQIKISTALSHWGWYILTHPLTMWLKRKFVAHFSSSMLSKCPAFRRISISFSQCPITKIWVSHFLENPLKFFTKFLFNISKFWNWDWKWFWMRIENHKISGLKKCAPSIILLLRTERPHLVLFLTFVGKESKNPVAMLVSVLFLDAKDNFFAICIFLFANRQIDIFEMQTRRYVKYPLLLTGTIKNVSMYQIHSTFALLFNKKAAALILKKWITCNFTCSKISAW